MSRPLELLKRVFPMFEPEDAPTGVPGRRREQETLEMEQARRLRDTVTSSGWKDVLDILERDVLQAEFECINYNGSDLQMLFRLQCRARAKREQFQKLQLDIEAARAQVENAKAPHFDFTRGTNY